METVLGLGAAGIEAGGLVAALQSAAAVGSPLAPVLVGATLPVIVPLAVVCAAAVTVGVVQHVNYVRVLPSEPTGEPKKASGRYVVGAHDFGVVLFWQHNDFESANATFRELRIRRILFDLEGGDVQKTRCQWSEVKHRGDAPHVDGNIRAALESALDTEYVRTLPSEPTGEPKKGSGRYVVGAHDFGKVLFWQSDDLEASKTVIRELRLRRILFDLESGPADVNGVTWEWKETKHRGQAPHVDNDIRSSLKRSLSLGDWPSWGEKHRS